MSGTASRRSLESYRYNDAAGALYQFAWNVFCDWYLELIKPILAGSDEAAKKETRHCTQWVMDQILVLLHPFMPFITEELWQKTGAAGMLIDAAWPAYVGLGDSAAEAEINWVIRLISEIRSVRSEMNVPAGAKIPAVITGANSESRRRAAAWEAEIMRLARLATLTFEDQAPKGAAQIILGEATVALPLGGVIDFNVERTRLNKELDKILKDRAAIETRLNNPGFVAKAPPEVLEEAHARMAGFEETKRKIEGALGRLG